MVRSKVINCLCPQRLLKLHRVCHLQSVLNQKIKESVGFRIGPYGLRCHGEYVSDGSDESS